MDHETKAEVKAAFTFTLKTLLITTMVIGGFFGYGQWRYRQGYHHGRQDQKSEFERVNMKPLMGIDTEATGIDIRHGCRPFMVATCDEAGESVCWEWDVDPHTRTPIIPPEDVEEIIDHIHGHTLVWHHKKFDTECLGSIGINVDEICPIEDQHDTLIAHHVLASSEPHGLKELGVLYLDTPTDDQEALQQAVNEARRYGRKHDWRIANGGDPHFPSIRRRPNGGWWPLDMWLPRAVALAEDYPEDDPWWHVAAEYGTLDPTRTLGMWFILRDGLNEEELWDQYITRRNLIPIVGSMENRGVSVSPTRLSKWMGELESIAGEHETKAIKHGRGGIENLRSPQQLQTLLYDQWGLPIIQRTKPSDSAPDGNPATDVDTLEELMGLHVDHGSRQYRFIENLLDYRKANKAWEYLQAYESACFTKRYRFQRQGRWRMCPWMWLHPNFNIPGTATTRFSSSDPNAQNIAKRGRYNLREVFGPPPGRCWLSMDFNNIEMRIFAWESESQDLIEAFESGRSFHMVIAEVLWPKEVAKLGEEAFKKTEMYGWVKNGNFSLIYGASPRKADATYHQKGAYNKIRKRLKAIDRFMKEKNDEAQRMGYITTLGGYRLQVPSNKPHVAVNYFVQGSAGWMMCESMIRCAEILKAWEDHFMIMQVHDELDFDVPADFNHQVAIDLQGAMEQSGEDYGLPTPVEIDLIRSSWASGELFQPSLAV